MMMTMPSLHDLQGLLHTLETRLAVFNADDPVRRAELEERIADLKAQIAERTGGPARLPYGDDE